MSGSGGLDPLSLIKRFSEDEKNLSSELFLAPCVPGGKITVRIKNVTYELAVTDAGPLAERGGFGLFQVTEPGQARCVEAAQRPQIDAYLKLLPRINMVLIEEFDRHWWAVQAHASDTRFNFAEPVPLRLTERSASFQQIQARFDGSTFWYHGDNRRRDPAVARQLREALHDNVDPDRLHVSGAMPSELFAYRIIFFDRNPQQILEKQRRERTDLDRLRDALAHAGARLDGYWAAQGGAVTVRYVVDGQTHSANVHLNDLTVVSAGVCLSGRDRDFDLTSLVGVMRQLHESRARGDFDDDD